MEISFSVCPFARKPRSESQNGDDADKEREIIVNRDGSFEQGLYNSHDHYFLIIYSAEVVSTSSLRLSTRIAMGSKLDAGHCTTNCLQHSQHAVRHRRRRCRQSPTFHLASCSCRRVGEQPSHAFYTHKARLQHSIAMFSISSSFGRNPCRRWPVLGGGSTAVDRRWCPIQPSRRYRDVHVGTNTMIR